MNVLFGLWPLDFKKKRTSCAQTVQLVDFRFCWYQFARLAFFLVKSRWAFQIMHNIDLKKKTESKYVHTFLARNYYEKIENIKSDECFLSHIDQKHVSLLSS